MFLLDGSVCWSPSDLTAATACEYAVLRELDYRLGRVEPIEVKTDQLMERIAVLGDRHEERVLAALRADGRRVIDLSDRQLHTIEQRESAADAAQVAFTVAGLDVGDVVYQPAFFDGELFGLADFVERTREGWLVADAKLARSAKPRALLQLAAYADQLAALDLPVAPTGALLLGSGQHQEFPLREVLPVFRERRERLRAVLSTHLGDGAGVEWRDERYLACGRCPECAAAAERTADVIVVAGLGMPQRRKLAEAGIHTIHELAAASDEALRRSGIGTITWQRLRSQAQLQLGQPNPDGPVLHRLTDSAPSTLARLPAPSHGDLFFDFEGDPLFDDDGAAAATPGLEYLWGFTDADGQYTAIWAHDAEQERAALVQFLDLVAERRTTHPDMHVYHYAPYETTALKRLAMRYQIREDALDDLLRDGVFVDLYATVRGAVQVSQPSYSIKKLEPLYMGKELRSDEDDAVGDGGASVVAYHEYRDWRQSEPERAARRLEVLADYNAYDCLSTLRLRDWLLERAEETGVREEIIPRTGREKNEDDGATGLETDQLLDALIAKAGPLDASTRTPEQRAYALLAASLGYHRREQKQFWWEHFWRLDNPIDDWPETRDVFVIDSAEVTQDWVKPPDKPRARNLRRVVRLTGQWGAGSRAGDGMHVIYREPFPSRTFPATTALSAATGNASWPEESEPQVVELTESRAEPETFANLPVALAPGSPPRVAAIEAAIRELCTSITLDGELPRSPVVDLLLRRPPRLAVDAALPRRGMPIENIVDALTSMTDSYVAVQGPPGAGKTYVGSHAIVELVRRYGWRVGVVAQSHAVVENMLDAVVGAGLDPRLVGKKDPTGKVRTQPPRWTLAADLASFLSEHASTGCVVGGTQWDFTDVKRVGRGELDLLVIDEAGQFSLAPTIAVSVSARRLLLLGDPQQLPQVSQGTHAEPVDASALGWLADGHDTLPTDLGYFLGESYRMHPDLAQVVSRLSYGGRLGSAAPAARRRLDGVEPGLHVVTLRHDGNAVASQEEADEVVARVRGLVGLAWLDPERCTAARQLTPEDVLVVAPYNAQVSLIRATLRAAGLDGVRVGTVDRFQGQEAPVVIVSMTASSPGDVPRGMGFLLNRNRINVAISRAQWCAIVIRSEALTGFMPTSTDGLLELGAFIALSENRNGGR